MCDNGLSETCWMRKRGSCHFDLFRAIWVSVMQWCLHSLYAL
jgi:hypothetical protein